MEIVIKISEDVYTRLFDKGIQDNEIATDDICEMARALRLGVPLPKGHGRIIDESKINEVYKYSEERILNNIKAINTTITHTDAPTIIESDKESKE